MPQNSEDKEVLYNIIRREIDNILSNFPLLGMFSESISNYVINYIDPYISAFIVKGQLDTNQLSAFANSEISTKIKEFKENYERNRDNYENKIDF